nr:hypothetical protein [Candidatus Sigynarchaeota archaeon]
MEENIKEKLYFAAGIGMFCWLFGVINYDTRFAEYFSCFSFGIIALGMVLKLKNEFLNNFTIAYLIVSIYLLARQFLWIGTYGLCADYTYLDPNTCGAPFWVH